MLLDRDDPFKIIGRTEMPVLIPEEYYERFGFVPNVVFPSGGMAGRGRLHMYYGAADTNIALANGSINSIIAYLCAIY